MYNVRVGHIVDMIGLGELDFLTMLCKVGLYWKIYNIEYINIMLGLGNNYNCLESS